MNLITRSSAGPGSEPERHREHGSISSTGSEWSTRYYATRPDGGGCSWLVMGMAHRAVPSWSNRLNRMLTMRMGSLSNMGRIARATPAIQATPWAMHYSPGRKSEEAMRRQSRTQQSTAPIGGRALGCPCRNEDNHGA